MSSNPTPLTMTVIELPAPSLELQAQFNTRLRDAVCDAIGKHQVREKNKIYRLRRKRKRCIQDQGRSYSPYSPRDREGLKRLRLCSEVMPVQSPHTGSWSLETRDTVQNEATASNTAQSNHKRSPPRLPRCPQPNLAPGLPSSQPTSILRPARSSHTEQLDDNASDWTDVTSESDSGGSSSSASSTPSFPSLLAPRPRKTVRFDTASLLASHATFRTRGYSDVLYVTLGRRRRREVVRKVLKRILRAFLGEWEARRRRREEEEEARRRAMPMLFGGPRALRALDEGLARGAVGWEERFREWDARAEEGARQREERFREWDPRAEEEARQREERFREWDARAEEGARQRDREGETGEREGGNSAGDGDRGA